MNILESRIIVDRARSVNRQLGVCVNATALTLWQQQTVLVATESTTPFAIDLHLTTRSLVNTSDVHRHHKAVLQVLFQTAN